MIENNEIDLFIDGLIANDGAMTLPAIPSIEDDEDFCVGEFFDPEELPLLALRNIILFPGQLISVHVGRERSARLVRWLERNGGTFGAITQRDADVEDPRGGDLCEIGTLATLDGIAELPNGSIGITIAGMQRFRLLSVVRDEPYLVGSVRLLEDEGAHGKGDIEFRVLVDSLKDNFAKLLMLQDGKVPRSYLEKLQMTTNKTFVVNFMASALSAPLGSKQQLLEIDSLKERGLRVLAYQQTELQMLKLKRNLTDRTQQTMDRQQREYFLQQQIRTFQEELGGAGEDNEIAELREQGRTKQWNEQVATIFEKELRKAERLNPQSPDYSVQMQYLRTILSLPWDVYTVDNFDLRAAAKRLDQEHYGLEKVKERILEHLAVLKLKGNMKSPIICLYGPPGVGKTSLGRSIAESLGRKYVRISLGGVHDESEIRGHRRTYIGAMCGRIVQSLQRAGSSNPVFVLDEIDKVGASHRGDPSSALLEVLDPEQNTAFHDNYLDIDYDLSQVLFIATANDIGAISQPLRDRMEMIEVSGYTEEEKYQIARKHLIPQALKDHGLEHGAVTITPRALSLIISDYTRESGVRMLNKAIASLMRKVAYKTVVGSHESNITPATVREYLGKPLHVRDVYEGNEHAGVVVGLAWTSVGGEILFVESSLHPGAECKITLTGNLGDVMKESAVLALDYIRAHSDRLGIEADALKNKEIHVHVPEGAVPKDGPSAGITIVTSMVSAVTRRRVRAGIAMTGEMTLRGKVLPVGGIKEKILAAKRAGIKEIILCKDNERDVSAINETYLKGLSFHYVSDISQVLALALTAEIVS